jgi:O-antigen/teichoic acid export membrane protein
MIVGIAFALNALANFLVGLLVAKFLGPTEYGRFAIAFSTGVMINSAGFDWVRTSSVRFYSERSRLNNPEVRATLDDCMAIMAFLVSIIVLALTLSGIKLSLSPGLLAMAAASGVASGLYDYSTALARARFLDKTYTGIIIVKNLLGLVLTVGGAWWFQSAALALAGVTVSVAGALVIVGRPLIDHGAGPNHGQWRLAKTFLAYGVPYVCASLLFQSIPLVNRALVSSFFGFAETGQFSLAGDIGIRVFAAIGASLDVLLFQLAVRADEAHGPAGARAQLAENMVAVLAIILPTGAGLWLALPSFQALIVPESFRGPFAYYLTVMLPGLVAYAIMQYTISPMFQIAKRTAPMILVALIACAVDALIILILPRGANGFSLAVAQSGAQIVGLLAAILSVLIILRPQWPSLREFGAVVVATGIMALIVMPLRARAPSLATLIMQIGVAVISYAALAYLLDVAKIRARTHAFLEARRARVGPPVEEPVQRTQ